MRWPVLKALLLSLCIIAQWIPCISSVFLSKEYYNSVSHGQIPVTKHFRITNKKNIHIKPKIRHYKVSTLFLKEAKPFAAQNKWTHYENANWPAVTPYKNAVVKKNTECKGMDNLTMDIGILSFVFSIVGSIIGVVDLILSWIGQFISVTSTWASYATSVPGALITLSGKTDLTTYIIANIFGFLSIVATVWSHVGVPVGYIDLVVGSLDEVLGLVSIILGIFSTFPETLEKLIEYLVEIKGQEVQNFVDNYGCGGS